MSRARKRRPAAGPPAASPLRRGRRPHPIHAETRAYSDSESAMFPERHRSNFLKRCRFAYEPDLVQRKAVVWQTRAISFLGTVLSWEHGRFQIPKAPCSRNDTVGLSRNGVVQGASPISFNGESSSCERARFPVPGNAWSYEPAGFCSRESPRPASNPDFAQRKLLGRWAASISSQGRPSFNGHTSLEAKESPRSSNAGFLVWNRVLVSRNWLGRT